MFYSGLYFLEIYKQLQGENKYTLQKYFLIMRAVELFLKSFLSANGKGQKYLKNNIGHNVSKAYQKAVEHGLNKFTTFSNSEVEELKYLNKFYNEKVLEYYTIKTFGLIQAKRKVEISKIESFAEKLHPAIEKLVLDNS